MAGGEGHAALRLITSFCEYCLASPATSMTQNLYFYAKQRSGRVRELTGVLLAARDECSTICPVLVGLNPRPGLLLLLLLPHELTSPPSVPPSSQHSDVEMS